MSRPEQFDGFIFGGGKSGKLLAWNLARAGQWTAVVEPQWVGGSCPNVACLPSKNEIWSAQVAHRARHGAEFGGKTGPITIDMAAVRQRKRGNERLETSAVLRTEATGETRGVMKALVGNDDRILGLTMLDSEAGEVMTVVQTAMLANLANAQLRDAVIAHTTISEGLDAPLSNVPARSGA